MYCWPLTQMFSDLPFGGSRLRRRRRRRATPSASWRPFGAGVRRVADAGELDERDDGEDDEDQRGADRPADLQARVAADLGGDGALARPELEQRVEQRALDADEDDERDDEDDLVERVDLVGVRRAAGLGRQKRRAKAAPAKASSASERPAARAKAAGDAARLVASGRAKARRILFTARRTTAP